MTNHARKVGTQAESDVREYLRRHGYNYAKRIKQAGALDEGDVHLGDGIPVCVEVKGGQKAVSAIPAHVREMLVEVANTNSETGVVIAKKARSGQVEDWYAVMTVAQWLELIRQIYPPPPRRTVRLRPNPRPN